VAAPAGQPLEALVRDELRGPVSELVRKVVVELVREQLNGSSPGPEIPVSGPENAQEPRRRPGPNPKPAPVERRCNRCGETKPAAEYARGRGTCRRRRRAQQRERDRRAALAEHEEPHPAPTPEQGRKSARRLASDRYWNERRRALIEEARQNGVTQETRDGRVYRILHLPSAALQ
jgi:hypothetical protein